MKGNIGKILHVDLGKGTFDIEQPNEEFYRKYIGGACMGAYYLLKGMAPKTDPLSPASVVAITTSSVVAYKQFPGISAYSLSKGAIDTMTIGLAGQVSCTQVPARFASACSR